MRNKPKLSVGITTVEGGKGIGGKGNQSSVPISGVKVALTLTLTKPIQFCGVPTPSGFMQLLAFSSTLSGKSLPVKTTISALRKGSMDIFAVESSGAAGSDDSPINPLEFIIVFQSLRQQVTDSLAT
ncbi:MAG TPA: hypothetical protein VFW59_01015 [Gallionella sp.]|nr:hypothetical protein [Gallionella sp.]